MILQIRDMEHVEKELLTIIKTDVKCTCKRGTFSGVMVHDDGRQKQDWQYL